MAHSLHISSPRTSHVVRRYDRAPSEQVLDGQRQRLARLPGCSRVPRPREEPDHLKRTATIIVTSLTVPCSGYLQLGPHPQPQEPSSIHPVAQSQRSLRRPIGSPGLSRLLGIGCRRSGRIPGRCPVQLLRDGAPRTQGVQRRPGQQASFGESRRSWACPVATVVGHQQPYHRGHRPAPTRGRARSTLPRETSTWDPTPPFNISRARNVVCIRGSGQRTVQTKHMLCIE